MIIGYPYIRWRVAYHAPTSYSVSEELHLHSLILYSRSSICIQCCMHWQLMHMRVHREREKKKILEKKKHVISQYRTCDLLTWSQQLFSIDHDTRTFSPAIRARSPTDTNIQACKQASKQKFLHQTPLCGARSGSPQLHRREALRFHPMILPPPLFLHLCYMGEVY